MKKIAVFAAIVAVAALAAPAFSATNPFMDVPMNHWAYDAIGQLAAHGILSGYPDGLYKGKQQTTRYEMASALARALAVVDMTKASKQDVEMLKRLVVEFKDELEALGVRVDELDERVAVLENRLGGWHIHGSLVLDVKNRSGENALSKNGDGQINFDEARLFFERTFGENDEYFFRARLRNDGDNNDGMLNDNGNSAYLDRYYVEMPFFMDSRLTVGRFLFDVDKAYRPSISETGSWTGGDSVLTDTSEIGFALQKNFAMGNFLAYAAHSNRIPNSKYTYTDFYDASYKGTKFHPFEAYDKDDNEQGINRRAWTLFAMGSLQFTENIGFDIGGQAFIGDNSATPPRKNTVGENPDAYLNYEGDVNFKNLWTIFAGLRFNFNDAIAIKGAFYHQKIDAEHVATDNGFIGWRDYGYGIPSGYTTDWKPTSYIDDANHWRAIIDVKQEALKFTSLWLEYGQYDAGFWVPQGMSTIFPSESSVLKHFVAGGSQAISDIKYWRVVLGQEWNEKWATHLFYYGYSVDDAYRNEARTDLDSAKPVEYGVGVQYKLNDATTMGLNYIHVDSDLPSSAAGESETEDNIIRFRTSINF